MTIEHFFTEPDHIVFLAALAVMWIGKLDPRWIAVWSVAGLAWIIGSHWAGL